MVLQYSYLAIIFILGVNITTGEVDILKKEAKNLSRRTIRILEDGSRKECQYGNCKLEEAEKALTPHYPRPWTISRVIQWYKGRPSDQEDSIRRHLAWLLGASRDPRAALLLWEGGYYDQIFDYFFKKETIVDGIVIKQAIDGGIEIRHGAVIEWYGENKERLQREAAEMEGGADSRGEAS